MKLSGMLPFLLAFANMLAACQDDQAPPQDADIDTSVDALPDTTINPNDTDADSVCDTDCLADRLLAMEQSMEPGCRCNSGAPERILTEPVLAICSRETQETNTNWIAPRECMAQYFSDPEIGAELESWIACREERIRTHGPCIMALEAGDSCTECPDFWADPCRFLDTDNNHFDLCVNQMMGLS